MKLLIAISTFGERVANVKDMLLPSNQNVEYLVVHQSYTTTMHSTIFDSRNDAKYISSPTKGVARSRNIAIDYFLASDCDLILFMDDDVELMENIYHVIVSEFKDNANFSGMAFQIAELENRSRLLKKYPVRMVKVTKRGALKIGTIELVCTKTALKKNLDCRFPNRMGAGTNLPNCDEPVFISRLLKNNCDLFFSPITIGFHPKVSSGKIYTEEGQFLCRGVAFREIFGTCISPFLLYAFYLKNRRKFSKFNGSPLRALFKGFWKSKEYLNE